MEIGSRVIDAIIDGKLFRIERVGRSNLIVWSANAPSQLTALINAHYDSRTERHEPGKPSGLHGSDDADRRT
jgi:hypothetical protein